MTNKNTRNRNNIILRENDNTIVDSNEVCEILTITLKYCFLYRIWRWYYHTETQ